MSCANPARTLECLACFIAASCFCINIYCYLRLSYKWYPHFNTAQVNIVRAVAVPNAVRGSIASPFCLPVSLWLHLSSQRECKTRKIGKYPTQPLNNVLVTQKAGIASVFVGYNFDWIKVKSSTCIMLYIAYCILVFVFVTTNGVRLTCGLSLGC